MTIKHIPVFILILLALVKFIDSGQGEYREVVNSLSAKSTGLVTYNVPPVLAFVTVSAILFVIPLLWLIISRRPIGRIGICGFILVSACILLVTYLYPFDVFGSPKFLLSHLGKQVPAIDHNRHLAILAGELIALVLLFVSLRAGHARLNYLERIVIWCWVPSLLYLGFVPTANVLVDTSFTMTEQVMRYLRPMLMYLAMSALTLTPFLLFCSGRRFPELVRNALALGSTLIALTVILGIPFLESETYLVALITIWIEMGAYIVIISSKTPRQGDSAELSRALPIGNR